MRARHANKLKHERAVADELLDDLKIKAADWRSGDPNKQEPDRIYKIDGKDVGIEVVTAYYSEAEAKVAAEIAGEKPLAPNEIGLSGIMGGPDDAICEAIQENLDEKCSKSYSGTNETWLCIDVDAAITEVGSIAECLVGINVPNNQFSRIFVTVRQSSTGRSVPTVFQIK